MDDCSDKLIVCADLLPGTVTALMTDGNERLDTNEEVKTVSEGEISAACALILSDLVSRFGVISPSLFLCTCLEKLGIPCTRNVRDGDKEGGKTRKRRGQRERKDN